MSNKIGFNSSIFHGFRLTLLFCIILCTKVKANVEPAVKLDLSKEVPPIAIVKTDHTDAKPHELIGLQNSNVSEDIKVSNSSVTDAIEKIPPPEDKEVTKSTGDTDETGKPADNHGNADSKPKDIVDDTNPNIDNNKVEVLPDKVLPDKVLPNNSKVEVLPDKVLPNNEVEKEIPEKETPGESQTEKNGITSETDESEVEKDVDVPSEDVGVTSEDVDVPSEDVDVPSEDAESESTHDKTPDEKVDSNENVVNQEPDRIESGYENDFSGVIPKTDIPPEGDDESNFSFFRLFIVVTVFFVLMYVGYYHRHLLLKHFSRDKSDINYHPLRTMQHNAVD